MSWDQIKEVSKKKFAHIGNHSYSHEYLVDMKNQEIIEDINKNRRWDAGNYLEHRQSEVIRTVDIEELRENWEIEVIVNWSQVLDEKSKNKNK